MSDPGGWSPSASAGGTLSTGDQSTLSNPYSITKNDLKTPITWNGAKTTIGSVLTTINNFSGDDMDAWQNELIAAGFLTPADAGMPIRVNDATNALLRQAALLNEDPANIIQQWADVQKKVQARTAGATATTPAGYKTNPLDVKYVGDTVAQKLVGRDLTPDEANAIAAQMGSQAYPSDTTTAGATEQYLNQAQGGQVQAHELLNVFEAIRSKVETDAQGSGPKAPSGPMKVL